MSVPNALSSGDVRYRQQDGSRQTEKWWPNASAQPPGPPAETTTLESRKHALNNVAKSSLIPDSVISRTRLRPRYGQGWQPPLPTRPRQADGRGPGEEESL